MPRIKIPTADYFNRHQMAMDIALQVRKQGYVPERACDDPRICNGKDHPGILKRDYHTAISRSNPLAPATLETWVKPMHNGIRPLQLLANNPPGSLPNPHPDRRASNRAPST